MGPPRRDASDFDVMDDPVLRLIAEGRAKTLDEAEAIYLDESLPEIVRLIGEPISNEELAEHPLFKLLRDRGGRGFEDSPWWARNNDH